MFVAEPKSGRLSDSLGFVGDHRAEKQIRHDVHKAGVYQDTANIVSQIYRDVSRFDLVSQHPCQDSLSGIDSYDSEFVLCEQRPPY